MKKLINKIKTSKIAQKLSILSGSLASSLILLESRVYADSNTDSIDSFISFACDWLTKIGGVIALVGGVMFALGWQREDAERKIKRAYDFNGRLYVSSNSTI